MCHTYMCSKIFIFTYKRAHRVKNEARARPKMRQKILKKIKKHILCPYAPYQTLRPLDFRNFQNPGHPNTAHIYKDRNILAWPKRTHDHNYTVRHCSLGDVFF